MHATGRRTFLRAVGAASATLALAGCTGGGGGSGDGGDSDDGGSDGFGISNVVFAAEEPAGYGSYEEQPDATYGTDEVIWLYFEVEGASSEPADAGEKRFDLLESLAVLDPDGTEILSNDIELGRSLPEDADLSKLFVTNDITLPADAAAGEYTVDVELTDRIAGATATTSATFVATDG